MPNADLTLNMKILEYWKMTAILSECRLYRYKLSCDVNKAGDHVYAFFGVYPSIADESIDDQTVKKWIGFTNKNGGKGFLVGNVFAYRSTDVQELTKVTDPVGPDNRRYINEIAQQADILVPCWGSR